MSYSAFVCVIIVFPAAAVSADACIHIVEAIPQVVVPPGDRTQAGRRWSDTFMAGHVTLIHVRPNRRFGVGKASIASKGNTEGIEHVVTDLPQPRFRVTLVGNSRSKHM